ncbi:MAG TPA: site-2 protease family protein [Sphingomonadaceae bacterium]
MNDTLALAIVLVPALVLAIVFHEVAHGYAALLLGDPTARERRRLSLNPLRHVDALGTIVIPGMLALLRLPVFGWAKPVPVDKWRLRNPRFGMMAVAAAGPGTNLVLAGVAAAILGLLANLLTPDAADAGRFLDLLRAIAFQGVMPAGLGIAGLLLSGLYFFVLINIFLALFNLLPIPPFDGSHIVEGLLPPAAARAYARLRPLGFTIVFLLILVAPYLFPGFDLIGRFVIPPVEWAEEHYFALARFFAGA